MRRLVPIAIALAAGCGSARRADPVAGHPALSAPARRGERAFVEFCNQCHPAGEGGLGPAINDKPVPAVAIKTQVRKGLGHMPAFGEREISDGVLDEIVRYLLELRGHGDD